MQLFSKWSLQRMEDLASISPFGSCSLHLLNPHFDHLSIFGEVGNYHTTRTSVGTQLAVTHYVPGMILQSSLFCVIVEGLQCAKLRLSTSVHGMTFQLPTPPKGKVFVVVFD